jgi:hypothetical protein
MDGLSYTTIIEIAEPLAPPSVAVLLRRTGRLSRRSVAYMGWEYGSQRLDVFQLIRVL